MGSGASHRSPETSIRCFLARPDSVLATMFRLKATCTELETML